MLLATFLALVGAMANTALAAPQPVLTLPYAPGIMDATLRHLCLYSHTNTFNLTNSLSRRNDSVCDACCGTASSAGIASSSRSCHQSPFALSYESGKGGVGCLSGYENAFQGWWLGQLLRDIKGSRSTAFGEDQPILVQIEGLECSEVTEADVVGKNGELSAVSVCGAKVAGGRIGSGVESE
jgi:hypothetical protein